MPRPWAGIARLGGIGDNLIASSVLPALARDHRVEVLTKRPHGVVFENNPHIERLTYLREADIPTDALSWQGWFDKRGHEFEFFVNLSHSCETLTALLAGQTAFYWPAAYRRKLCGRNYLEVVHDICGVAHEFDPRFFPTDDELLKATDTKARFGARLIGWCLSGTRLDKMYPATALAIARVIKETGVPVMMFGAPGKELEMARTILAHVRRVNGSHDGLLCAITAEASADGPAADWPIRRSLAQVQTCDLVIGPDTGPLWAVAMEAVPKIVLLSHASALNITAHWRNTVTLHADPERVRCYPCHRLHDDIATCHPNKDGNGAACISDISVETIVQEAKRLLQGSSDTLPACLVRTDT